MMWRATQSRRRVNLRISPVQLGATNNFHGPTDVACCSPGAIHSGGVKGATPALSVGGLYKAPTISCAATANIISATPRSIRRQVRGLASQGASQAAPSASVLNQRKEALAAPAA